MRPGQPPRVPWRTVDRRRVVRPRAAASATVVALLLTATLSLDAVALTWGPTTAVTSSRNATADRGLAVTTGNIWHAVYSEARGGVLAVRYRRSSNAGANWIAPVVLSGASADTVYGAAVVARGTYLDAAWIESRGDATALVYRRSTNAGVAWSAPVVIAGTTPAAAVPTKDALDAVDAAVVEDDSDAPEPEPAARQRPTAARDGRLAHRPRPERAAADTVAAASPSYPRLVRDSANRVVVTWTDDLTGTMYVRRSTDGGVTWLAAQTIDTTTNKSDGYFDAFPEIAAGTDVLYLAYYKSATSLRVRRSTNGGASWTAATTVASNGSGYLPSITASGSTAIVGYAVWSSPYQYTAIRRTTDKGATWKPVVKLGAATGYATFQPMLARGGSRWHAVYERCLDAACTGTGVYYRSSADGITWTTAVRISSSARPFEYPGGLAYADRIGVAFGDNAPAVLDSDLFFRAGS